MSAAAALVQAILAAPDDDTPRLVYADWLQEHGGVRGSIRAKLIRGQCELERMSPHDPRRRPLAELCTLYESRCYQWLREEQGAVADLLAIDGAVYFFRGLPVAEFHLRLPEHPYTIGNWLGRVPAEFDIHLRITAPPPPEGNVGEVIRALTARSLLGRVTVFELYVTDEPPAPRQPLFGRMFPRLRWLTMRNCGLGDIDVVHLIKPGSMPGLRRLSLTDNRFTAYGLRVLAESRMVQRLHTFDIRGNDGCTDPDVIAACLLCPDLRELEAFDYGTLRLHRDPAGILHVRFDHYE